MTETHVMCLCDGLSRLLGEPADGAMAYIRCLPSEVIVGLCGSHAFQIPGWQVYAVGGNPDRERRSITADEAVNLREEKQGSILLLVDTRNAGAGMDGIYSAGREIEERDLLPAAAEAARQQLPRDVRKYADRALGRARKLGRAHTISPYRAFDFYAHCAAAPETAGGQIASLGLWPIETRAGFDVGDLEVSAQLVERLLLSASAADTVRSRIDALLLHEAAADQRRELEVLLRGTEGKRWTEAALEVRDRPQLWLNVLEPGFVRKELQSLQLVPWRGTRDKLLAWSGLIEDEGEEAPTFRLPRESQERGGQEKRLEVRWKTSPVDLPPGAVAYEVSVVTDAGNVLAHRSVTHSGKEPQRCAFAREDFADLEEDGKWEVKVRVHPVGEPEPSDAESGEGPRWKETESFILCYGESPDRRHASVGRKTRALVEEAIRLPEDTFAHVGQTRVEEDRQGYITCRVGDHSARVGRPGLIRDVERDWSQRGFGVGRWVVRIRTDGSAAGAPAFVPLDPGLCAPDLWRRLEEANRQAGQKAIDRCGFLGLIYRNTDWADRYVNAWAAGLEGGPPLLSLAHTVEVQTLSGETLGLIVLPSHPLRVAWHQAYDELAYHSRYQEGMKVADVVQTLRVLDGSYVPSFLPGFSAGTTFVFGDTLGFHAVAMLRAHEPEPQATLALMARCLSAQREDVAPSVGGATAEAIGREIARYANLHPEYPLLRLNALRPGDGLTVARALGAAMQSRVAGADEGEDGPPVARGFRLDLFPGPESSDTRMLGRFLSETTEQRRAGIGTVAEQDRWMLETYVVGGIAFPRLRWAKRREPAPTEPGHLAVAFDTFASEVVPLPAEEGGGVGPLEVYGLVPSLKREFRHIPRPTWKTTVASQGEGDRHPVSRGLSDRLLRTHAAVLRATALNLGGRDGEWPTLVTQVSPEKAQALSHLHALNDWVITVDRNAGLEYFDAPREAPDLYETYVIDCVPERQDQDGLQLVTSTCRVDEVRRLLDHALADMALSCSPRNCDFLLSHLKAVSGRLAMRLASHTLNRGELIALALFHANCDGHPNDPDWVSLEDGFLVPLDDVRELLQPRSEREDRSQEGAAEGDGSAKPSLRSDLVYVSLSRRGALQFNFVEVKYRRLLSSARAADLLMHIQEQTAITRQRWLDNCTSPPLSRTQLAIRRRRLARALRFYADKGRRYQLKDDPYRRLCTAINKLLRADAEPAPDPPRDLGYVFCPDHSGPPSEVANDGQTRILLFGPQSMPDAPGARRVARAALDLLSREALARSGAPAPSTLEISPSPGDNGASAAETEQTPRSLVPEAAEASPVLVPDGAVTEVSLLLGRTMNAETPVEWPVSIQGNPHLMIVGLPGMGKTTCIVNLCAQLAAGGITPLIFSYHDDLEAKLGERLGALRFVNVDGGLGFNPMQVTGSGPHAWIDSVGMLRDVFASIYPDLGDLQTHEIREAIKQSYQEKGYGAVEQSPVDLPPPEFQRFFDLLRRKPRPNPGLMARLEELNDYGFFRNTDDRASLLESREATVVRLHRTQNEVIQNAMASFVLLNVYQSMFLRGAQPGLTHAVVLDEAHRASRLKLLPTMAKECRKFGLALLVASQEAKDFSPSLYAAVANYLVLRVTDADANALAKNVVESTEAPRLAGRLKQLDPYCAMFVSARRRPTYLSLEG